MLINEVIVKGSLHDFASRLLEKVQDIWAIAMKRDIKKVSVKKFKTILSKNGYKDLSTDQLKLAVDQSGWASSIDDTTIVPKDELGTDIDTEVEPSVDVGAMAGNQALSDIKSDL